MHTNIGYDPAKAFAPVGQLIETPHDHVRCIRRCRCKTMAEVVTYAKANPGKLSWGSQGFGTRRTCCSNCSSSKPASTSCTCPIAARRRCSPRILAGEVQIVADPRTTSLPHIQAGKLRPIAIAGDGARPKLPNVPTVVEAGFPKLQSPFWLGVVAPAGTPREIIDKLNAAFRESLAAPETRARLATLGAEIKIGTPEELGKMLAGERAKWSKVVKAANIKME